MVFALLFEAVASGVIPVKPDRKPDAIYQSFDADRRKMALGPNITRQQRDEIFYRAGFAAGKASQVVDMERTIGGGAIGTSQKGIDREAKELVIED